jgi:hypothetical protein
MKKALFYTLLVGVLCVGNMPAVHAEEPTATAPQLMISEIQTADVNDATEEFVEIYNPSDEPADITGWQLQYRAASGTTAQSWPNSSTKATFACPPGSAPDCRVFIAGKNRVVATHTLANIVGALPMTGGFSGTGGQIRLLQPGAQPIIHDFVGYGTAATAETTPAAAPAGGKSIKRIVGAGEELIDTNNNSADFIAACGDPTPGLAESPYIPRDTGCETPSLPVPETPSTEPEEDPSGTPPNPAEEPGRGGSPIYLPVIITEVFADPESPQQDSTDEFIEIYNPNDTAITLKDYLLQTGSEYRYTYTLGDTPLGPHMYLAIPSAVSKLSLANSGSGVRLIDPNGQTVYETPNYGDAKAGQSWMQDETGWKWTLTPTPGAANIATAPQPKVVATATPAVKKKATPKTTTKKASAPKAAKAAAAKKTTAPQVPKTQAAQTATAATPQYWLLAPIGALAAGYAAYEYRQGISRGVRTGWAKIRGKEPPTQN